MLFHSLVTEPVSSFKVLLFCSIPVPKSVSMVIFSLNHWEKHLSIALQGLKKMTKCYSNTFPSKKVQADRKYRKFYL